ncbi:hypothetical protein CBR_g79909, partial [Chara braunii]
YCPHVQGVVAYYASVRLRRQIHGNPDTC